MRNKGQLSALAIGIVLTIVVAFIGLFAVQKVANLMSETDQFDYAYTTSTNTSKLNVSIVSRPFYTLTVASIGTIKGETATREARVWINNSANLGGVVINMTFGRPNFIKDTGYTCTVPGSNITRCLFSRLNFAVGTNNITIGASSGTGDVGAENTTVANVTLVYPNSRSSTQFGSIASSLTTNTGTVYDVIILVVIVVALGVAIAVLRGFNSRQEMSAGV